MVHHKGECLTLSVQYTRTFITLLLGRVDQCQRTLQLASRSTIVSRRAVRLSLPLPYSFAQKRLPQRNTAQVSMNMTKIRWRSRFNYIPIEHTPTLCELTADLSQIPKQLFRSHVNSKGVQYYKVDYNLVLTPRSASLLFELQFNGMNYGTVQARYI